jgi:hypothetical protein
MQRLRSMIFPVVIGDGKRLFAGIGMHAFELAEPKTVGDDGLIVQIYSPEVRRERG